MIIKLFFSIFFFFVMYYMNVDFIFFFQAEDGIRDGHVTGVQTCALPISSRPQAWDVRSSGGIRAMIRNFHVLYVGQIELDNIGRSGTPANERRYSAERLREVFATAREIAQLMDRLGYDVLWTAEHHFQREGYECLPNLIQLGL